MRSWWVHREIDAPAPVLWQLLTEPEHWPRWGPTVRSGRLDDGTMALGATGSVTTIVGIGLPFEITAFDDGRHWAWRVAGVPATEHTVEPLGPGRCRVGFGVPMVATPYLLVCRLALSRLATIAEA